MDFLKRAWLSSKVKYGRTILLCAVFSAILIFILAGLTIRSASVKSSENAKKQIGATATLSVNRDAMFSKENSESSEDGKKIDPGSFQFVPISMETVEKIAKLPQVKSFSVQSTTSAGKTDSITPVSSTETEETTDSQSSQEKDRPGEMGGDEKGGRDSFGPGNAQGDFSLIGVIDTANESSFASETAKIVDGEGLTAADEGTENVLIESTLAETNDLSVGDTFELSNPTDEDTTYKVTVKGIYETSESGDARGMNFNFLNPSNTIYTSYTFADELKGSDYENTVDTASFTLDEPDELATFVKAAEKEIDTDTYSIQTNDQMYQQMLQPIDNIASFAKNIVLLVSIAGIIILALIVMLTIRERRYEIGVLLSLGERRFNVILQMFSELLIVLAVSLVIAGFGGQVVGNVVGEQLLKQEETAQNTQTDANTNRPGEGRGENGGPGGGGPGGGGMGRMANLGASDAQAAQKIEELEITTSPTDLLKMGGIGLLICLISVLLSSFGIIRLQPKKILTT